MARGAKGWPVSPPPLTRERKLQLQKERRKRRKRNELCCALNRVHAGLMITVCDFWNLGEGEMRGGERNLNMCGMRERKAWREEGGRSASKTWLPLSYEQ